MTLALRVATAADAPRCLELLQMLADHSGGGLHPEAESTFHTLLDGTRGEVLVAEEDGRLLGMATVSYNLAVRYGGEYCQLEELIVDPAARGKNAGGALVEETIRRARARGCREYGLYLVPQTESNYDFYAKYGFERVGSELRQRLD